MRPEAEKTFIRIILEALLQRNHRTDLHCLRDLAARFALFALSSCTSCTIRPHYLHCLKAPDAPPALFWFIKVTKPHSTPGVH